MLMCSAYNFYPRMIRVTWYRDGQKVTSDVSATEELADGDWFYQIHSHLEFTPKAGEKISCVVEHASFKEPREFVWGEFPISCHYFFFFSVLQQNITTHVILFRMYMYKCIVHEIMSGKALVNS